MDRLSRLRVLPQCAALLVYGLFSIPCQAQETKESHALPDQKLQMTLAGVSMSEAIEAVSKAVHIVAAASALRLKYETPVTPASLPELENQISLYKAALNKTDFDAAWSFGSTMTMENAVGYVRDGRLIPRRTPEFEATDDPALG